MHVILFRRRFSMDDMGRDLPILLLIILLLSAGFAGAGVDILSSEGSVYLAWSASGQSILQIYGTATERTFGFPGISIGVNHPPDHNLLVAVSDWEWNCPDSLLVVDPLTLDNIMARQVTSGDIWGSPIEAKADLRLARHDQVDSGIWMSSHLLAYSPSYENAMFSLRFVPDSSGIVLDSEYAHSTTTPYMGASQLSRPVRCAEYLPAIFFRETMSWHSNYFYGVYSALHQPYGSDWEALDFSTVHSSSTQYAPHGSVKAAGSCSSEILLLWTMEDSLGAMYSTFDGLSPDTISTSPIDLAPPESAPWALSCSPDDPGLLFAWVEGGELRCRHYESGWNPDLHVVQEDLGEVSDENISVCSDEEGYWIAWLEDYEAVPDVVFVPRDSVTSVEEEHGWEEGPLSIRPIANPTSSAPVFVLSGPEECVEVGLFDLSGRLIERWTLPAQQIHSLDAPLEPGTYLIVARSGDMTASCKVVQLD
jgi:hypothetical protein